MSKNVAGKEHCLTVRENDFTVLSHNTQAVTVAVIGNTDFGIAFTQSFLYVFQIFQFGGIRMMIREVSVHIRKQTLYFDAETSQQVNRQGAGKAVARIDNCLNRSGKFDVGKNLFHISRYDINLFIRPFFFSGVEFVVNDHLVNVLNGRAVERLIRKHHLQTVVVRRIVASGDGNAASCFKVDRTEIEHRGRNRTDVINADSGLTDAFH